VQVCNLPPVVTAAPAGQRLVTFVDPGRLDLHTATIDWGDGSPVEPGAVMEKNGAGSVSGIHHYGSGGTYLVKVTVSDADGGVGSASFERRFEGVYLPLLLRNQ
jgi:hypothetical protein